MGDPTDLHDQPTETLGPADVPAAAAPKPASRSSKVGSMLGRYVVLGELGRGGMSIVYIAYDPQLDRRVALKVVRGDKLSEAHRARLHREAQALARLSHPAIVTVFDVGDLASDTFVAMELVDGMTLREWSKANPNRTWREIVAVFVQVGRGLAAAHAAGIVHRDVKPDNIVVSTAGGVKLVDFGLARDLGDRSGYETPNPLSGDPPESGDDLELASSSSGSIRRLEQITHHNHIVGTPAYMPPEQRGRARDADERSDQFSFCATLYEALYHQKPFASSKKAVLDPREQLTVADKPNVPLRTLAAPPPPKTDVPAWLQKVVTRGLAVDRHARYATMDALLGELDRDPQRTRRRVAVGASAAVGVAAIATLVTWRVMPTHESVVGPPVCGTGDDRVATTWSPARRAALDAAAKQDSWAQAGVAAFAGRVDKYAADWKAMYRESCEATHVRATQSPEALDLRSRCLDRRLAGLDALVAVTAGASADELRDAGKAVDALPPVADCADVTALRAVAKRPTDPATTKRLAAIDGDLARVTALYAIGDVVKAGALDDAVIAEARKVGYDPTLAQALYWRGRASADRGGGTETQAIFEETLGAALSAGDDRLAADAAARMAQEALWATQLPDFHRWSGLAKALAKRTDTVDVTLFVDQLGCMANHFTGKVRTRLACLRELAARRDALHKPSEWLVTTLGIAASEAGELADAIHWLERGVELARAENGADHPRTLEMRAYLCHGLDELGDFTRSAAECGDALARLQKVAPDDKAVVARLQLYLGQAELGLHHTDRARPLLEAAAKVDDDDIKLDAETGLGTLRGAVGDTAAAVTAHRASLAEMIKTFGPFDPHHPNIVAERHELGNALLDHGEAAAAAAELARADGDANPDEISPLELAQIRYARSRAVAKSHGDLELAKRLAADALAIYQRAAPPTEKFQTERAAIERWLASLRGP